MIKYLAGLSLSAILSFAGMIGGVSMTVDNQPITVYEVQSFMQQYKLSAEEAVNRLIQRKIEESEIKRLGIIASPYEVDKRMKELAERNNLSYSQFLRALKEEGQDEQELRTQIEDKIKQEELHKKIIGANIKKPDEEELKSYYNLHKDQFTMPTKVKLIEYISKSKEVLEQQQMQPMAQLPGIDITPKEVEIDKINPQFAMLFSSTQEGTFTPIINLDDVQGMFFIQKKSDVKEVPFAMAKQQIYARVMQEKEQAVLIEYFEKKKSEANIKVIRKPV